MTSAYPMCEGWCVALLWAITAWLALVVAAGVFAIRRKWKVARLLACVMSALGSVLFAILARVGDWPWPVALTPALMVALVLLGRWLRRRTQDRDAPKATD